MSSKYDAEGWFRIPHFPQYEISREGRIRNRSTFRVLRGVLRSSGYIVVTLREGGQNHNVFLHVLVCSIFHGKPSGRVRATHKNGDTTDNHADNLEWKVR